MANFCNNCGRPLKEGEVCSCMQKNNVNQQNQGGNQQFYQPQNNQGGNQQFYQPLNNQSGNQQFYQPQTNKGGKIPKLLVPIGQIVAGGILIIFGLMTGGWDWSYISYVSGAGFLLTGICGLIDSKK